MGRWPEKPIDKPKKFEFIYKDEDGEYIWKYDLDKFPNGPISVENKWTSEYLKKEKERMKYSALEKRHGKLAELHAALDKVKEKREKESSKKASKTAKDTPKPTFNPKEKVTIKNEVNPPKSPPKTQKNTPKNFW